MSSVWMLNDESTETQIYICVYARVIAIFQCGAIDPDCGYVVENCHKQEWWPEYAILECNGIEQPKDLYYCRLDSAICQPLPPGLARDGDKGTWYVACRHCMFD